MNTDYFNPETQRRGIAGLLRRRVGEDFRRNLSKCFNCEVAHDVVRVGTSSEQRRDGRLRSGFEVAQRANCPSTDAFVRVRQTVGKGRNGDFRHQQQTTQRLNRTLDHSAVWRLSALNEQGNEWRRGFSKITHRVNCPWGASVLGAVCVGENLSHRRDRAVSEVSQRPYREFARKRRIRVVDDFDQIGNSWLGQWAEHLKSMFGGKCLEQTVATVSERLEKPGEVLTIDSSSELLLPGFRLVANPLQEAGQRVGADGTNGNLGVMPPFPRHMLCSGRFININPLRKGFPMVNRFFRANGQSDKADRSQSCQATQNQKDYAPLRPHMRNMEVWRD
jgi:hypothetical protein